MSRVDLGFPHEFLRSEMIRDVVHGNIAHLIDDHRGQYPFATMTGGNIPCALT